MIYGYARCSTSEDRQDIDRQKRELYSLGVKKETRIYWEYESGTKDNRAELQKMLDVVQCNAVTPLLQQKYPVLQGQQGIYVRYFRQSGTKS